jgi:hypothetical protein
MIERRTRVTTPVDIVVLKDAGEKKGRRRVCRQYTRYNAIG